MEEPLFSLTLKAARDFVGGDPVKSRRLIDQLKKRAAEIDPKVKAYLKLAPAAESAEEKQKFPQNVTAPPEVGAKNFSSLLFGIPISIKDNIVTAGWETTCGSRILKGFIPPYDAAVIRKLREAGAVLFGKCNMDEFAFGSSTETSAEFLTRNPWDLSRVPGGSSGGSAACVAADEAIAALGTDTGGSIRQPAAFCGVVGLKPTYGRVSRYGLVAFGSSLDQIGPITKTVEDAAILLEVIAGHDERDSTSADMGVPRYTDVLGGSIKGMKIGIPKEYFVEGCDPEIHEALRKAEGVFGDLGAECVEISLPHSKYAVAVYYVVAVAEASSNLGRFDGVRYGCRAETQDLREMYFETRDRGFGAEAKRRILLGTFVLSHGYYDAYYLKGLRARTLIKRDFDEAFQKVDLILGPTSPTPPFKIGEKIDDPLAMYLSDIYTIPANLAGIPAMSLPCGFTADGLPIGLQLSAKAFDEETIFKAASAYEAQTQWHEKRPSL